MFMDYEKLLERGMKKMPKAGEHKDRLEIPKPQIMNTGSKTFFNNLVDVASAIRRDPQQLMKFLLKELATKGEMEGKRAVFQGFFTFDVINRKIELYIKTYVTCPECGKLDSKLLKEDRYTFVKCEACGARHPVSRV
jgi:translation initiation factor 2 subunit 2